MILLGVGGISDLAQLVAAEQVLEHSPLSAPRAPDTADDSAADDPTCCSSALHPAR